MGIPRTPLDVSFVDKILIFPPCKIEIPQIKIKQQQDKPVRHDEYRQGRADYGRITVNEIDDRGMAMKNFQERDSKIQEFIREIGEYVGGTVNQTDNVAPPVYIHVVPVAGHPVIEHAACERPAYIAAFFRFGQNEYVIR
jgi:hypothetical protein